MTTFQKVLLSLGGVAAGMFAMKKMSSGIVRNYRGLEMRVDGRDLFLLQEGLSSGARNVYVDREYATDAYIGKIKRTSNNLVRAFPPANYAALDGTVSNATSIAISNGQLFRNIRPAVSYLLRLYTRAENRFLEHEGAESLEMVEWN